jgi:hypothetical protein
MITKCLGCDKEIEVTQALLDKLGKLAEKINVVGSYPDIHCPDCDAYTPLDLPVHLPLHKD